MTTGKTSYFDFFKRNAAPLPITSAYLPSSISTPTAPQEEAMEEYKSSSLSEISPRDLDELLETVLSLRKESKITSAEKLSACVVSQKKELENISGNDELLQQVKIYLILDQSKKAKELFEGYTQQEPYKKQPPSIKGTLIQQYLELCNKHLASTEKPASKICCWPF
jgi:hypothetical protein